MTRQGHYFEVIIPGQAKVIKGTVPEIVKNKALNPRPAASCFKSRLKVLKWGSVPQKDPVSM